MLAAIQGPNLSSLGITLTLKPLQQADKLSSAKLLAWCPRRLKGAITFLKGLKIFRRYLDREWIVITLLSISISKTFQKVGDVPFALRVGATLLWSQS
jgi:hypothetical protein